MCSSLFYDCTESNVNNDTASISSKTLPPRNPKCCANVFLSIFVGLMWCSEGTRGKLCGQRYLTSMERPNSVPTAKVKTGSSLGRTPPFLTSPKQEEALQMRSSSSLYGVGFFYALSLFSSLNHF